MRGGEVTVATNKQGTVAGARQASMAYGKSGDTKQRAKTGTANANDAGNES